MSQDPYSGPPYSGVPNPNVPGPDPAPAQPPTQPYPPAYGQQPGYPQQQPPGYPPQQPAGYPPQAGPAYPQQPYAQPAYGQPVYPQQPQFPPIPPAPKKTWTLPIVLVSVAIVLVLCIGGVAVFALVGGDDEAKNDASTSTSADPAADPTTESATEPPATAKITVTEPKTLGGRPKLDTAAFAEVTKTMEDGLLTSYPGATKSFGAFYGTPAKKNMVMAIAVAAPIPNPALELDKNFTNAALTGLAVEDISAVDTGSMGGSAKCGNSESSGVDLAVCVWADDGSVGMLVWYYSSASKAKAEFPKVRAQMEQIS